MNNTRSLNKPNNRITKSGKLSLLSSPSLTSDIAGYPRIKITNETPYTAVGTIFLESCLKHTYTVTSNETWEAPDRHLFLLTGITAVLTLPDGSTVITAPYISATSSGTSFSRFSIVQDQNGYRVVRNA